MNATLQKYVDFIKSKEGRPYCWPTESNGYSGKDLKTAKFQNCYDCSGLVTCGIFSATDGKMDLRQTHNAQRLFDTLAPIDKPDDVCLVFYGFSKNSIYHVMTLFSDGRVFGASGGDHTTASPAIANARGARVRFHSNVNYMPGVKGFRRLPFEEDKK